MRDAGEKRSGHQRRSIGILFAWFVFLFLWTSDFAIAEQSPLPTFYSTQQQQSASVAAGPE